MAGKPAKPRHVPQRTCVGCRSVIAKRTLTRIVRCPEGVFIDPTGKMNGRGAYLHDQRSCWERALKGALANGLKTSLTPEDRQRLESFLQTLPAESSQPRTDNGNLDA
ncbi:MAG: YlxR family protein [Chloroflexota bacterium]